MWEVFLPLRVRREKDLKHLLYPEEVSGTTHHLPRPERATRAASGKQGLMTPMSFVSGQGGKGVIPKPKLRSAGADVCLGREFGQDARGIQCRGPCLNPTGAFEVSS